MRMVKDLGATICATLISAAGIFGGIAPAQADEPVAVARSTQFLWPTVAGGCLAGQGNSVGTAVAVPGPSAIPFPGAAADETVFLFTALGTGKPTPQQGRMMVDWVNLDNFRRGTTSLEYHGVNPQGPVTLSGTAQTGKGRILAVVRGTVNTSSQPCTYLPTVGYIEAR